MPTPGQHTKQSNIQSCHFKVGTIASLYAGADQAVQWILEHQGDPAIDQPLPALQPSPRRLADNFSTTTAGIAGILRREEQRAAATDEWALLRSVLAVCLVYLLRSIGLELDQLFNPELRIAPMSINMATC